MRVYPVLARRVTRYAARVAIPVYSVQYAASYITIHCRYATSI